MKMVKKILIVVIVIAVVAAGGFIGFKVWNNNQPKADISMLTAELSKSSELTSAKLKYTGMVKYEDTGVKFINKSNFTMIYEATVRAGINVDEVKITADDESKIIYLTIPKAVVQDVNVDPESIQFVDEKFSMFNSDEKEDGKKAEQLAKDAAEKEAAEMGILELADEQSESLIKGILANAVPDGYEIKVK